MELIVPGTGDRNCPIVRQVVRDWLYARFGTMYWEKPSPPPGYVPVTEAMAATGQSHSWVDYHGRKGHFSMIRDESTVTPRGGCAWVVELAGVMDYYRRIVLGELEVPIPAHYVMVKVVSEKYGIPNPWLCCHAAAGHFGAVKKPRARGKWPWYIDEEEAVAYRIKTCGKGSLRMPGEGDD